MLSSNSIEDNTRELNNVLKIIFPRRDLDYFFLVTKNNRCKITIDLITLVAIKSEAQKLYPFDIGLVNTLKKFISSNSNKKDTRLMTLNESNTFLLEISEEKWNSSETTISALLYSYLLSGNIILSKVCD